MCNTQMYYLYSYRDQISMPWTNKREKEVQTFDARENIAWYADCTFKERAKKTSQIHSDFDLPQDVLETATMETFCTLFS